METRRWTNPSQPQTLQIAVFLLYANAVLSLLLGSPLAMLVVAIAGAAGAYGIANNQRWGYWLAVGAAGFNVGIILLVLMSAGIEEVFDPRFLINALFPVALFCALVHPQSREHQRLWFD